MRKHRDFNPFPCNYRNKIFSIFSKIRFICNFNVTNTPTSTGVRRRFVRQQHAALAFNIAYAYPSTHDARRTISLLRTAMQLSMESTPCAQALSAERTASSSYAANHRRRRHRRLRRRRVRRRVDAVAPLLKAARSCARSRARVNSHVHASTHDTHARTHRSPGNCANVGAAAAAAAATAAGRISFQL